MRNLTAFILIFIMVVGIFYIDEVCGDIYGQGGVLCPKLTRTSPERVEAVLFGKSIPIDVEFISDFK